MNFPSKHRKPHAWIREQLSKSAHLLDPTHAGTKYPRSGEPLTSTYHTVTRQSEVLPARGSFTRPSATGSGVNLYGAVNTGAFIKYYIGAFNAQLTEYNQNLRKAVKYLRAPYQILETSTKTSSNITFGAEVPPPAIKLG